jgi:hypothetical protein
MHAGSMLTVRESVTSIQLRDTENKLALVIVVLWNSLSIGLRQAQSLDNFERASSLVFLSVIVLKRGVFHKKLP